MVYDANVVVSVFWGTLKNPHPAKKQRKRQETREGGKEEAQERRGRGAPDKRKERGKEKGGPGDQGKTQN